MAKLSDHARAERREIIVAAAFKKFAAQGFHATSMADIIAESGVAAGTVYLYFSSKDDLIVSTCERALDGIGATLEELVGQQPTPSLPGFLNAIQAALPSTPDGKLHAYHVLHCWAETSRNQELADLVRGRFEAMLSAVLPLIEVWQARGELPSDKSAAEISKVLLALVLGDIVQAAVFSDTANHPDIRPVLYDSVLQAVTRFP